MSKVERMIENINTSCGRCLKKCKGCDCGKVDRLMNEVQTQEKKGTLTKEDYEAYMRFMRG